VVFDSKVFKAKIILKIKMKTLFIEAKYTKKIKIKESELKKLPKKIGLQTTVQFVNHLKEIQDQLIKHDIKPILKKAKQIYPGQILGCDVSSANNIKDKVDAFLYIGTGKFHPIAIGLLNKPVYILNPMTGIITTLKKDEVIKYQKKKQGALLKFYNAKNIGILLSTKYGQKFGNLNKLKEKYKDKQFYEFVFDTINKFELENFSFIDCFVNTACPRIDEDFNVLNVDELNNIYKNG
jgi:2-(3-amino-3-carboxypropyl)histidine synthase